MICCYFSRKISSLIWWFLVLASGGAVAVLRRWWLWWLLSSFFSLFSLSLFFLYCILGPLLLHLLAIFISLRPELTTKASNLFCSHRPAALLLSPSLLNYLSIYCCMQMEKDFLAAERAEHCDTEIETEIETLSSKHNNLIADSLDNS